MKKTFIGSLITLGTMFMIAAVLFGIGVASPEGTWLYNTALGGVIIMFCSSPLVMLVAAVSGIGALINQYSGQGKRKREITDFGFDNSDYRLEEIMQRLTPEQQVYLENRLRNEGLGLSSDGEIVSMDDLFDDIDQKQKRF